MDSESSKLKHLEHMLFDETSEPTDLPISLLKTITEDFSSDLEIGSGGFAVVYKGFLGNGSARKVAVKKLFDSTDMDETKYNREVECLMRVKHKNIVRFLGYCAHAHGKLLDFEGKFIMADVRHRLLCFEYLSNGSLHKYITDASNGLEWGKRYEILKGICEGLRHLHELHIVHLDLKPDNILLNDKMVPKISDFGLSRLFDESQTRTMTSRLCGSFGYLAPELHGGVITFKSDIYSLGVIFTEILTGKKGYYPVDEVLQNWRNRFETGASSAGTTLLEQVRVCTEISIQCMDVDPENRPAIQRIIQRLEETQNRTLKLAFKTQPLSTMSTGTKIVDARGNPLEIILQDASTGSLVVPPQALHLKLVLISGDFPPADHQDWAARDFENAVRRASTKSGPQLMGDMSLTLRDGRATVGQLVFTDASDLANWGKFRIGVQAVPGSSLNDARVHEAITEAFKVIEGKRKHYPPLLSSHVWRLEKIAKNDSLHQKLRHYQVDTVQEFLRMLTVKPDQLRAILHSMGKKAWESLIEHARTCVLGDKVYAYSRKSVPQDTIYVNSIFKLARAKLGGVDYPLDQLNAAQMDYVQNLILEAYQNRAGSLREVAIPTDFKKNH